MGVDLSSGLPGLVKESSKLSKSLSEGCISPIIVSELELIVEVIVELVVFSFLSGGLGCIMGLISPESNVENSELLQSNVLSGASEILFLLSDWAKAAFISSGSGRSGSLSVNFLMHCFNELFFNQLSRMFLHSTYIPTFYLPLCIRIVFSIFSHF